jgi:acyl-CoA dehydrogenase
MQQCLFKMFSRVETCRALSRAMFNLNSRIQLAHPEYSIASKVTCTELCFENTHDAVQILGGYGLTKEYNTEKLFRDSRAN